MNGSPEREEKESPAKMAPAKKKRARVLSSSSNGSGGDEIILGVESGDEFSSSSSSSGSSSEDETDTEVYVVNASIGTEPPLLVQKPPLLVQRCNGTTARLGLLEVCWVAHAKIPHRAVCL